MEECTINPRSLASRDSAPVGQASSALGARRDPAPAKSTGHGRGSGREAKRLFHWEGTNGGTQKSMVYKGKCH